MKRILLVMASVAAVTLGWGGPATAAPGSYTCAGGEIASGTYASISVTGACGIAKDATITVVGNIEVAAGAMLDSQTSASTITVGRNVTAGAGSVLGLGCQPPAYVGNSGHQCSDGSDDHTTITVHGNVTATDAAFVALNGNTIDGNVTLSGGGAPAPWSIKNNEVGRNVTISGVSAEWLGVMFNHVAGNVVLTDIEITDVHPGAPGVYVVRNHVGRNLVCTGLTPGVSGGFVPGSVNTVGHKAIGQCASLV